MSTFAIDNLRGRPIEEAFESLLDGAGIRWGKNPWNGTKDPRRADFDEWLHSTSGPKVEVKANHLAEKTGNVCIEEDILDNSKAHYFVIAFPVPGGWYAQVLDREDIHRLLNATRLTFKGRFHKFKRVQAGQWPDNISALVPVDDILKYGQPVLDFIAGEAERVAFWKEAA